MEKRYEADTLDTYKKFRDKGEWDMWIGLDGVCNKNRKNILSVKKWVDKTPKGGGRKRGGYSDS